MAGRPRRQRVRIPILNPLCCVSFLRLTPRFHCTIRPSKCLTQAVETVPSSFVLRAAGFEVAGCDASEAGVAIAQQTLGNAARLKHLSVYDDLAASFGCDWDIVVATEVVEHLYAPREFVKRARALLKRGGILILSTPYHGYLKNLVLAATGAFDAHFTALWDGGHIKFWSYNTLTTLLKESQFEGFRFDGAGRLPWLWKSMVISCHRD
jgi:2-polyprenyl-3-methyl-5-hydroxy-6-metoxy-1,4-benzoquinol methylase